MREFHLDSRRCLGPVLDSPWPGAAAASFPLIGKYYLLNCLGHISYLLGATRGLNAVALRLLPDQAIDPFMRTKIVAPTLLTSAAMLVCLGQSPATSTMPASNLYFVAPDGWLSAYWVTYSRSSRGSDRTRNAGVLGVLRRDRDRCAPADRDRRAAQLADRDHRRRSRLRAVMATPSHCVESTDPATPNLKPCKDSHGPTPDGTSTSHVIPGTVSRRRSNVTSGAWTSSARAT